MRAIAIAGIIMATVIFAGCATTTITKKSKYGPGGTLAESSYSKNERVLDELKRVLEKQTVQGKGIFTHENIGMARVAAMNLAINDLAARAGEVIASQDVTLYNDKISSIIRTQARSIVKGYEIVAEEWDKADKVYEIVIEMHGSKIAEQIHKYTLQPK